MNGISALIKKDPRELPCPFRHVRTPGRLQPRIRLSLDHADILILDLQPLEL